MIRLMFQTRVSFLTFCYDYTIGTLCAMVALTPRKAECVLIEGSFPWVSFVSHKSKSIRKHLGINNDVQVAIFHHTNPNLGRYPNDQFKLCFRTFRIPHFFQLSHYMERLACYLA